MVLEKKLTTKGLRAKMEYGLLQLYGEKKLFAGGGGNDSFKKPFPFRHVNKSLNGDFIKCVYLFYYLLTIYM